MRQLLRRVTGSAIYETSRRVLAMTMHQCWSQRPTHTKYWTDGPAWSGPRWGQ